MTESAPQLEALDRVRVVMVETSHPGNIGAAARAMKTMGLSELWLVAPKRYPSAEATARASGADDLLARARVVQTLPEALADCHLVFGSSARLRSLRWPQADARESAEQALSELAASPAARVAMVFGRERTGLSNEELDRCHRLLHVPVNPDYGSLNVAMAVQIVAYELRMAALAGSHRGGEELGELPVDQAGMEQLYAHFEQALIELDFLDPDNPKHLMRRLRRLFNRVRPTRNEVNILRGILTAAQKCCRGRNG